MPFSLFLFIQLFVWCSAHDHTTTAAAITTTIIFHCTSFEAHCCITFLSKHIASAASTSPYSTDSIELPSTQKFCRQPLHYGSRQFSPPRSSSSQQCLLSRCSTIDDRFFTSISFFLLALVRCPFAHHF